MDKVDTKVANLFAVIITGMMECLDPPVIMSHLKSIPKEYDAHIYYVEDESVEGLKNRMIEVCNKTADDLREFGESASRFIYKKKSPIPQMAKVIKFIESL